MALSQKYLRFQRLLTENNQVLSVMADMEEKLTGEYLFDRQYLNKNVNAIVDKVFIIIENLNIISNNRYRALHIAYDDTTKEINKILFTSPLIPISELTVPLDALNAGMSDIAGGKMAHIGEIKNRLNLLTPEGFTITSYAFKRFIEHNRLTEKINETLAEVGIEDLDKLGETCKGIQGIVSDAEMPHELEDAIKRAVEGLKQKVRSPSLRVSIRSSAVREDGEFSFAGQYSTFLNVNEALIIQRYKDVVASLFTPRAIFYYKTKGFSEADIIMAVGVLEMVDVRAGGVVYSTDPNDPEGGIVIINAVCGVGKTAVDGSVTPDSYTVSKAGGGIVNKSVREKQSMLLSCPEGDVKAAEVPEGLRNIQCLTDDEINILSDYAVRIETHYGRPQDIEWAVGNNGKIYILQSRPLRIVKPPEMKLPRKVEGYSVLLDKGVIACKGVGCGKAFILKEESDLSGFPEGAILVARHTSTKFVTVMNKASAIITDVGGATGHMASLSREYRVPTIVDTQKATAVIRDGEEITVDAINCNVYAGRVQELLEYALKKREFFKDTHLFMILKRLLKWIVPLNLIDPDDAGFMPENCRTLHDITRFAHEKAMEVMFYIGERHDIKKAETIILKAGIPLDAHLLDIDGGIKAKTKKATQQDILSIPFSALLKGMTCMRWPEPRAADVKGFMGMMAHTASIPEGELYQIGEKSFAILSGNYMNFSIRLGYHFSMVESYAGENINDNYIKFFFKGGGAVADRRLRRVRLISEILKKLGFKVNVTGDVVDAAITKYKQSTIEEILGIIGKLTAYTKQLDMALFNDAVTDMFIEEFIKDHLKENIF